MSNEHRSQTFIPHLRPVMRHSCQPVCRAGVCVADRIVSGPTTNCGVCGDLM
jgi:hypothetical protein